MGKKERLKRRVDRIDTRFKEKVRKGKKGTDMDIAIHEARIQRLADKGGFKIGYNQTNNPFNRKNSPLNEKKNSAFTNYIDWDGDGKAEGWEYALEGVTWIPTALAAAGTSPTGPGAIAAGAATKAGVTGLLKAGVKKIAKSKIGKWLTLGDRPKTTMGLTAFGKTGQIADAKKTTEMQDSGYQNTEDLPENENSTNIFDK